jgi:Holliday junction resolvasome RuvABC DNA-binding subunit
MISFIEGKVESATPLEVVINCQGVGYCIHVPSMDSSTLRSATSSTWSPVR